MKAEAQEPGARRLHAAKAVFAVVAAAAIIGLIWAYRSGNLMTVAQLRAWITGFGVFAPFVFIAMYGILVTFGFPAVLCSTVGGLVFGRYYGTVFNLFGACAGASGAFWISRLIARDLVAEKLAGAAWFGKFSRGVEQNGFYYMLFVRLLPVFPFNGLNYASGVTNIRYRHFLAATMIGMLPYDFALTNTVAEVGEAVAGGFMSPGLIAAVSLLAFASLAPIRIKKYIEQKNAQKPAAEDPA